MPYVDRMGHALAAADVIVCRAGANTMAEVAARRVPAIVVPYPHAGAHQEANARPFVEAGAAVMVRDAELSGEKLAHMARALLADAPKLRRMADAAGALAPHDAADAVADTVMGVARRAPTGE
jgi:UDP-N-acetylglucosamine--N-acetylmuramyl-(pentapeptide) pyrophosphoryl-undecaprenol N-acetylglucosamine transferase